MDLQQAVDEIHQHNDANTVISEYKDILYKTSSGSTGSTAHMLQKSGPFGRSCGFSIHLAKAGNYVNNSMNTTVDNDKVIDQSKDWMAKNN